MLPQIGSTQLQDLQSNPWKINLLQLHRCVNSYKLSTYILHFTITITNNPWFSQSNKTYLNSQIIPSHCLSDLVLK